MVCRIHQYIKYTGIPSVIQGYSDSRVVDFSFDILHILRSLKLKDKS